MFEHSTIHLLVQYSVLCTSKLSSQPTEAFMLAFWRFIALRGRPILVCSDNDRKFRGAFNALQEVDWDKVAAKGALDRNDWRFNPPRAAWWGGFWEHMVGILKIVLRKILGQDSLTYLSVVEYIGL
uniref:Integrase catalytic domain-containing protein n=1 Tax=Lygus hesperus TaxID=30085 RepID=A0A0K8T8P3_LYGHE